MHIGINAHLLSGGSGYRSAGIHSYMRETLRHLPAQAPEGWQFSVMVGAQAADSFPGMNVRRSSISTESPLRRILWEQFIQPFHARPFDLLHALAFVSPLVLTKPSVVTVYDLSFIHYPQRLPAARRLYLRGLTGLSCRRAAQVIAISHSTARDLTETLEIDPARITVAAPGYDRGRFQALSQAEVAAFRAAKHLPDRFWLFIGTLEPRKNLVTLLEAYASLPTADRLPLVIGGDKGWDYQPIFETVARHQLGDQVRFEGFIPAQELAFWYNAAEAFLYPSIFEGFGLPILEAMACGTPVIVSDVSALPEVAGDAGMRVPPTAIDAWREALKRASADAAWRSAARAAGMQQAQRFSWEATARATIDSYRKVFESA
jgi:glycosyltransferase involved in cell wall biosynthesis